MAYLRNPSHGNWEAQIRRKGHPGISATRRTKAEAALWAKQVELDLAGGKKAAANKTMADVLVRYRDGAKAKNEQATHNLKTRINRLLTDTIASVRLKDLDATHFAKWRDQRLNSVCGSTVIRDISILYAATKLAINEWHWMDRNPLKDIGKPAENPSRERRISNDEIAVLITRSGYSPGVTPLTVREKIMAAFLFAIETGMRAQEITGLTMDRVHLDRRVVHLRAQDTKTGKKRDVPLSSEAIRIIKQMNVQGGPVFGLGRNQLSCTFVRLRHEAGIDGMTFHDSRHEATARLSKKFDPWELARALGHENMNQTLKYYRTTADDMAKKLD